MQDYRLRRQVKCNSLYIICCTIAGTKTVEPLQSIDACKAHMLMTPKQLHNIAHAHAV